MRTARPPSCTAVYRAQPAAARLNSALSSSTSALLLCSADTVDVRTCPHPPFGHLPPPAGEGRGSALRLPLAGDGPAADVAASSSTSALLLCSADTVDVRTCPIRPSGTFPRRRGRTRLSPAPAARGRWPASRCRCVVEYQRAVALFGRYQWMSELAPIRPSGTFPRRRGKDAAQPCACRSRAIARQPMSLRWKALLQWIGLRPA